MPARVKNGIDLDQRVRGDGLIADPIPANTAR
jgi:hypothetical protein